ncbi:MAG: hypothetical protein BWK80_38150, partial [Desulfobacteraceae bacterium IS3]
KLTAVNNGKTVGKTVGKNHRFYLKYNNVNMIENMRKRRESVKDAKGSGTRIFGFQAVSVSGL